MVDIQDIAAICGIIDDDTARRMIQDGDNVISSGVVYPTAVIQIQAIVILGVAPFFFKALAIPLYAVSVFLPCAAMILISKLGFRVNRSHLSDGTQCRRSTQDN